MPAVGADRDAADVVLFTIHEGGHTWPGGEPLPEWFLGPTSRRLDATREMWAFFERHAKAPSPAGGGDAAGGAVQGTSGYPGSEGSLPSMRIAFAPGGRGRSPETSAMEFSVDATSVRACSSFAAAFGGWSISPR